MCVCVCVCVWMCLHNKSCFFSWLYWGSITLTVSLPPPPPPSSRPQTKRTRCLPSCTTFTDNTPTRATTFTDNTPTRETTFSPSNHKQWRNDLISPGWSWLQIIDNNNNNNNRLYFTTQNLSCYVCASVCVCVCVCSLSMSPSRISLASKSYFGQIVRS